MSSAMHQTTDLDFVEQYAAAAERFAVAVAWADLRRRVPSCPGWSTYDLVVHLGNVHSWAATIVETGRRAPELNDEPASAKPRVVSAWYAGKAEDLYEVLRGADPEAPCWNFAFGAGTAAFWQRRQLHETTIHQVDLDLARGSPPELAPAICRDGVDEVLGVFLPRMHRRGYPAALERPLALTATDTGDSWVVTPSASPASTPLVPSQPLGTPDETVPGPAPRVEHHRGRTDVADRVEAPADDLYRLLWKRLSVEDAAPRLVGDEGRVRAFLASRLVP